MNTYLRKIWYYGLWKYKSFITSFQSQCFIIHIKIDGVHQTKKWEFQTVNLTTSYWNFLPSTIHSHRFNIDQNISWSNVWWNRIYFYHQLFIVTWKYSKTSNLLLEVVIIIKLYDKACNTIVCFFEQEFNQLCKQWTILSITPKYTSF